MKAPAARKGWHALARSWYRSLARSGQARFYEPSDWEMARWCAELMTLALEAPKPAPLVAQVRGLMTDLLVAEGPRRRALIELERQNPGSGATGDEVVAELDAYRRRTGSGSS